METTLNVFLSLLQAGLWERKIQLSKFREIDYAAILQLAEEQSVVGLVAAGLENATDTKPPKKKFLQFVGRSIQIEQQNSAMNRFIAELVNRMTDANIYTLLVRGQGIAQCYERPLWRSCGDVDFLLNEENYKKAKDFLIPIATHIDEEDSVRLHLGMSIDSWWVELHGTIRSGLWKRIDKELDKIQDDVFVGGNIRLWMNSNTRVNLPRIDEDIVLVFSHILQHFFKEGIGLRQICDLCRLLWINRESLDLRLLESRLNRMGIMSEWKVFAALVVDYLDMPANAIPFYSSSSCWSRKAILMLKFIIKTGNFGHNRDYSYYQKYPFFLYKAISLWRHIKDGFTYSMVFPIDTIKVTVRRIIYGFSVAIKV